MRWHCFLNIIWKKNTTCCSCDIATNPLKKCNKLKRPWENLWIVRTRPMANSCRLLLFLPAGRLAAAPPEHWSCFSASPHCSESVWVREETTGCHTETCTGKHDGWYTTVCDSNGASTACTNCGAKGTCRINKWAQNKVVISVHTVTQLQ